MITRGYDTRKKASWLWAATSPTGNAISGPIPVVDEGIMGKARNRVSDETAMLHARSQVGSWHLVRMTLAARVPGRRIGQSHAP